MTTLMILSVLLFAATVAAMCIRKRQLPLSVVETARYAEWPWRAAWYITAGLAVVCSAPAVIQCAPEGVQFLAFLALGAAMLCIIATYGEDKPDNVLGIVGTVAFYLSSVILVCTTPRWPLALLVLLPVAWTIWKRDPHLRLYLTATCTVILILAAL